MVIVKDLRRPKSILFLLQKTSGVGQGEKDGPPMEVCQDYDDA